MNLTSECYNKLLLVFAVLQPVIFGVVGLTLMLVYKWYKKDNIKDI